jgi:hypothetical protein
MGQFFIKYFAAKLKKLSAVMGLIYFLLLLPKIKRHTTIQNPKWPA